jgi:hypothetical protein
VKDEEKFLPTCVHGHVAKSMRVTAQLIDAETGAPLWAERFDRGAEDLLTLQAEVTGQIARMLNLQLMEAESQRATRGRTPSRLSIMPARPGPKSGTSR